MRSDRKIPLKRDETDSLTRPAGTTDAATSGLVVDALRSETAPLPSDVQRTMESRLRHDFSRVRIHAGPTAARAAERVEARAFTVGSDVVFGRGTYAPHSSDGQSLLAHELTHVAQQSTGPVAGVPGPDGLTVSTPGDPFERAADTAAARVGSGSTGVPLPPPAITPSLAGAATPVLQRDKSFTPTGPNSSQGPAPAPASTPGGMTGSQGTSQVAPPGQTTPSAPDPFSRANYQGINLSTDPMEMRRLFEAEIAKGGLDAGQALWDRLRTLPTRSNEFAETFAERGWPNEKANYLVGVVVDEGKRVLTSARELLTKFEQEAKDNTLGILAKSRDIVEAEAKRYGITDTQLQMARLFGPDYLQNVTLDNSEANTKLAAAAKELADIRSRIAKAVVDRNRMMVGGYGDSPLPPGEGNPDYQRYNQLADQIKEDRTQLAGLRAKHEGAFPLLAAYSKDETFTKDGQPWGMRRLDSDGEQNTTALIAISKGGASAGAQVGPMVASRLKNIKTCEDALKDGELNIWKTPTIVNGTKAKMGLLPKGWEDKVVTDQADKVQSDAALTSLLIGAVALGLGLLAAIPTGGASMVVAAGVAGAAAGSAALSAYQGYNSYKEYELASAEAGTAFDKAKAISQEDPSLMWLAVDVVAVILDVKGATTAFKTLAGHVRRVTWALATEKEAIAGGKVVAKESDKEIEALRRALSETKSESLAESVLKHIREAAEKAKPALEDLEKAARTEYQRIKDAGKLAEIGNPSEEAFVQQLMSNARSGIMVSGEAGISRVMMATELLKPGNPKIAAVLKGDVKAMDALLTDHGNWKQLMTTLEGGSPEMREAAKKIMERRASIVEEVKSKFGADYLGKPSNEPISDVDLSTKGEDAGKKMIEAEQYVKKNYGEGWSEALRMNFYTEGSRLTLYEKIMPGLSGADKAKFLQEMTKESERLNIAKMLHHAEGDPARIAEIEAYAKKAGVDIKDPEIQKLADSMGGAVGKRARDQAVLEIDEMMKKYNSLPDGAEKTELAKKITLRQMAANALTDEAYISPGAVRALTPGMKVVGFEAYQAALSQLEMIQHILAQCKGNIALATREYELYKYINRFATLAEGAGVKNAGLDFWKNFSGFSYKTERAATADFVHLDPRFKAMHPVGGEAHISDLNPHVGEVTDPYLKNLYNEWNSFSQQTLGDMKKIANDNPEAWLRAGPVSPAAGAPPAAPAGGSAATSGGGGPAGGGGAAGGGGGGGGSMPPPSSGPPSSVPPSGPTPTPPPNVLAGGQPLSAAGDAGALARTEEGCGVFEGHWPGHTEEVVVKVYPENHPLFVNDMEGAKAASETKLGPKFYGEVQPPPPQRRGFVMSKVKGTFIVSDKELARIADPAKQQAAKALIEKTRGAMGEHTLKDVENYSEALLKKGYGYEGEVQGLVDEAGHWKPIDFQSMKKLPDPAVDEAAYKTAVDLHKGFIKMEVDDLKAAIAVAGKKP